MEKNIAQVILRRVGGTVASVNMAFWMAGNKGTLYIDNLIFQKVNPDKHE